MANIGNIVATLSLNARGWTQTLKRSRRDLKTFVRRAGKTLVAFAKRAAFLMTLAAGVGIAGFITLFIKFEEAMRNVNTIAKQSEIQLVKTTETVIQLSREFGRVPTGLAQALYDINSASFIAEKGLTVLRASTVAARAGLSTTREAARAITGALNAYALSAKEAADISDTMFQTVKFGVLTFGDLAGSLGIAVSTAAAAKVPFDQLSAAAATMTRGGINVREAFTALNRVMLRIIQNRGLLGKVFATTAEGSGSAMLKVRGLAGTMEFLQKVTKGEANSMIALGFMVRDLKAALSLTRNEGRDYAKDIGRIADRNKRAGATMEAFKEQTKALGFQWALFKAELIAAAISIGGLLAPAVRVLLVGLTAMIKKFNSWVPLLKKVSKTLGEWVDVFVLDFKMLWTEFKFVWRLISTVVDVGLEKIGAVTSRLGTYLWDWLMWLSKNWKEVFINIGSSTITIMENMVSNLVQIMKALPGLITGKVKWKDLMLKALTEDMELIKLTAAPEFQPFQTTDLGNALREVFKKRRVELEKLYQPYKHDPSLGPLGRQWRTRMRSFQEAFEGISMDQQKGALSPQALRIGATTVEKGTVEAWRAERGLRDPTTKAAEETSANTKAQLEIMERASLLNSQLIKVGF